MAEVEVDEDVEEGDGPDGGEEPPRDKGVTMVGSCFRDEPKTDGMEVLRKHCMWF